MSRVSIPFGKYKGQSIERIAESDEGLLYLDWLVGQSWLKAELRRELESYLGQPTIRAEVQKLVEEKS